MKAADLVIVGGRRPGKATAQMRALMELSDHCHWRAKAEELFSEVQALRAQMAAESARLEWCIGVLIALPGFLVTDTGCGCCGDQMRFDETLDGRAAIDLARGATDAVQKGGA